MTEVLMTKRDLNPVVNGPSVSFAPLVGQATSVATGPVSLRTTTGTAGEILELLSENKDMELPMMGNLSSSSSDCLTILDHSGKLAFLDEAIRYLENSEIIELRQWKRLAPDRVFLVYGLGDGVKRRRRTPLQADGASKAPPHENGIRLPDPKARYFASLSVIRIPANSFACMHLFLPLSLAFQHNF